ncbi:MAG: rhomboid family intramembrane serine protease [Cyanothece sp. SIO1E1]|nr:rhomboid family intramembrane serine protease [Cyanothece sp. SIO1E1]
MDFNYLLIWTVCFSCGLNIVVTVRRSRLNRSKQYSRGWVLISAGILAITLSLTYLSPTVASVVGGCLWSLFILLPALGLKSVNQLIVSQRFKTARQLATILYWFHPVDGWREYPAMLRVLEMGQQGNIELALAILNQRRFRVPSMQRQAIANLYQMGAQWEELLSWLQQQPAAGWRKDSVLVTYYLRALGETGNLNHLIRELEHFEALFEKTNQVINRSLGRMFAFAFCGYKDQVHELLNGPLAFYPAYMRQFWLATAELATNNNSLARQQLTRMLDDQNFLGQKIIQRRLEQPWRASETMLDQRSKQTLARISLELEQEGRYSSKTSMAINAHTTFAIIGLNVLVFLFEVRLGGSQNVDTLYQLGALVPEEVIGGAWWRLLSSTFLHYGFFHLLMNMIGLYILAPFVEFALGARQYLVTYFTAGVGSMLVVTGLSVAGYTQSQFVVGASGCVMGMVGATAAILLRGWQQEKARIASKRLQIILLLISFQIVFDLSIPQVSFTGHTSGLMIGFIAGFLSKPTWQDQLSRAAHAKIGQQSR